MRTLFGLLILSSLIISCNQNGNCLGTQACTEELRIITVDIYASNNSPVSLDSAYSILADGRSFSFENDDLLLGTSGTYTILTDAEMDHVEKRGTEVIFEGWIDQDKVISEVYLIGHDCCHIELLDGETNLIID
jgi:hypothetical protein